MALEQGVVLVQFVLEELVFLYGFEELQAVGVRQQQGVRLGQSLLDALADEVRVDLHLAVEPGQQLLEHLLRGVLVQQPQQGVQQGQQQVDHVVDLEHPDVPDLGAPPVEVVVRHLPGLACFVQLLVHPQLDHVIVDRDQHVLVDVLFFIPIREFKGMAYFFLDGFLAEKLEFFPDQ